MLLYHLRRLYYTFLLYTDKIVITQPETIKKLKTIIGKYNCPNSCPLSGFPLIRCTIIKSIIAVIEQTAIITPKNETTFFFRNKPIIISINNRTITGHKKSASLNIQTPPSPGDASYQNCNIYILDIPLFLCT